MKDLTKGKPSTLILSFALPIFLGNLLQLTYSLVDTRIVGSFSGRRCTGSSRCDQHTERSDHRIFTGIIQRICDYYRTEIWCEEHRRYEKVLCNVACDRDWNIHFIYDSRTAIFETDLTFLKCAKASGSGGERIYRDHHSRTACNIFI